MRLSALRTRFCAAIENSIFFDRNLPTDFDNLFARQSEIARDREAFLTIAANSASCGRGDCSLSLTELFTNPALKGSRLLNTCITDNLSGGGCPWSVKL